MNIRPASLDDLARLVEIYNQAIAASGLTADTEPYSTGEREAWFFEHSTTKYPILVAESGERLAAYLSISPYRPGRRALRYTAEVSFYVDFEEHGKGIATQLMQHAIELCPTLEIKNLFAILMERNLPSIALLEKFGFQQWGYLPQVADYEGMELGQHYYGLRIAQKK